MVSNKKYVTVSIPRGVADAMDELIEELGYWPSRGAFVREATLDKIRKERKLLKELREDDGNPIKSGKPDSDEGESRDGGNRSVPRG